MSSHGRYTRQTALRSETISNGTAKKLFTNANGGEVRDEYVMPSSQVKGVHIF